MKYNKYIKGSPAVSEIGLGAWQLGENSGWKCMTEGEAIDLVHNAVEAGINFFDTAPVYGLGSSEIRLGMALKKYDRSTYVVNTKFGRSEKGETNFDAALIRPTIEGSLKRLKIDYIDSVIIHNPPFELLNGNDHSHYEIFEKLIDEGKIFAYGASLDTHQEMDMLLKTTNSKVVEAFFNILHQDIAQSFAKAKEQEVAIIVKIPLDSGWLTGKYHAGSTFNDVRSRWSKQDIETRAKLVQKAKNLIGDERQLVQAAISFCLAYKSVSTVIPGNTSLEQLRSNLNSIKHPLSDELVKKLEDFYETEVRNLRLPW